MIRIWIAGGQQAQFLEHEDVCVCRRVWDGEYIEDERWERAEDLARRFDKSDHSYPLILSQFYQKRSLPRPSIAASLRFLTARRRPAGSNDRRRNRSG